MKDANADVMDDRTLTLHRHIPAPVPAVWAAWTDPERLPLWWGPRGFTCRTHEIDLREGGLWRFDMVGPDGTVYPNRHRYTRMEAPHRIDYAIDDDGAGKIAFEVAVTFVPRDDGTDLRLAMQFDSAETRRAMEEVGAREGGFSTFDCLAEAVLGDSALSLTRYLAAPPDTVWAAWTDPAALAQWYCPDDVDLAESRFDIREGGTYACVFVGKSTGKAYPFSGEYLTIEPPSRLVYTHGWEDEHGRIATPTEISVTLQELAGGTVLTFLQTGLASAESRESHSEGWGQTLDHLKRHLQ